METNEKTQVPVKEETDSIVPIHNLTEKEQKASIKSDSNAAPKLTPSTEDRTAVLAPDDTFPGSGPLHRDDF